MLTRRGFLATGAAAAPIVARPSRALAQTPKRGGTLTIRAWDPPHFDASLVDARLDQKEYGAYQATCPLGKFDSTVFGPLTPFLDADNFLFGQYYAGEPRNRSHVKDPALDDLLVRQRRAMDVRARREIINGIQRHLARQQYYVQAPTGTYIAVWDGALKNYGPNLGYDYGGRLVAAWLDR